MKPGKEKRNFAKHSKKSPAIQHLVSNRRTQGKRPINLQNTKIYRKCKIWEKEDWKLIFKQCFAFLDISMRYFYEIFLSERLFHVPYTVYPVHCKAHTNVQVDGEIISVSRGNVVINQDQYELILLERKASEAIRNMSIVSWNN